MAKELLASSREWLAATGEIARFAGNVLRDVWGLRVFRFFGETLRQSGILIISSTLVIWGLVFIVGLGTCGTEGAYFTQAEGAPVTWARYPSHESVTTRSPARVGMIPTVEPGTRRSPFPRSLRGCGGGPSLVESLAAS